MYFWQRMSMCVHVLLSVSECVCGQLEAKHRAVYGGGA